MSKLDKPRLGRGLRSLISVDIPNDDTPALPSEVPSVLTDQGTGIKPMDDRPAADSLPITQRVIDLALDQVRPNPHQPRRDFDESSLKDLAVSLKANGVIQPIVVRRLPDGFELIAGERRLRAAKQAGLLTIPAIVKEVDGLTQAQWALVENIQRENLNPMDRAEAYRVLLDQLGLSHAELAQRLGEDRTSISNHLRLLDLAAPVRVLIRQGQLSLGHAKVLAGVPDVMKQDLLAKQAVEKGLSVRGLEAAIQALQSGPTKPSKTGSTPHIRNLEKSISGQLGMRVNVRSKANNKGSLVINYTSLDQFDDLMSRLGVKLAEDE